MNKDYEKTSKFENFDGDQKSLISDIKKSSEEYAEKSGFKLNPDLKQLDWVFDGLVARKKRYGEFYCPCRVVSGNKEEDKKKICPCFWHKDEIKKWGHCLCKLFLEK